VVFKEVFFPLTRFEEGAFKMYILPFYHAFFWRFWLLIGLIQTEIIKIIGSALLNGVIMIVGYYFKHYYS
jgi:hypothetical protein